MNRVLAAPLTEFFKFQFSFNRFFIFLRMIIQPLADRTLKFYYFFLRFH